MIRRRHLLRALVLGVALLALPVVRWLRSGRAAEQGGRPRAVPVEASSREGAEPQYRDHLEFGAPTGADPANDIRVVKPEFVLSYNPARGGPNWVSWHLNATHFGDAPRCDCFTADTSLPAGIRRVVDSDYRGSGYDRGHMVQSESRTATAAANAATFLLTNILPQAHANNAGPWLKFETFVDREVRGADHKEAYLVAGGEYAAEAPTLKNAGRVAIPDYTWKVVVFMKQGQGLADVHSAKDIAVYALRIPNLLTTAPQLHDSFEPFLTTVDDIEARTGLDLLTRLPEEIQHEVESAPVRVPDLRWLTEDARGSVKHAPSGDRSSGSRRRR